MLIPTQGGAAWQEDGTAEAADGSQPGSNVDLSGQGGIPEDIEGDQSTTASAEAAEALDKVTLGGGNGKQGAQGRGGAGGADTAMRSYTRASTPGRPLLCGGGFRGAGRCLE